MPDYLTTQYRFDWNLLHERILPRANHQNSGWIIQRSEWKSPYNYLNGTENRCGLCNYRWLKDEWGTHYRPWAYLCRRINDDPKDADKYDQMIPKFYCIDQDACEAQVLEQEFKMAVRD